MANNFAEAFFGGINDARQSRAQQEQADQSRMMNTMRIEDAQQQRQVSQQQALYGLAKGYKDYLAQNPQGGAMYYERFLKPSLAGLGLGDAGPYNEPEAVALADQVLAAYSGGGQSSAVQSTFVDQAGNRVAIMRDGTTQVLGQNAPNNQIIDTGNGYVGVNKGSLQANPVMLGGIPPGGQFSGPDGMPIQIDPNLPPAVQQAISANPSAWAGAPDGASVQLPNQQAARQLRSAPKAQAPSDFERRLDLARGLGATPEEQRRMVVGGESARDAQRISAKDANTARLKLTQIQAARQQVNSAKQAFEKLKGSFSAGLGGQYLPTPEGQAFDRAIAQLNPLITAVTRVPGVGSMSDYEGRLQAAGLPSRGTYEDVTVQQFNDLENLLNTIEAGYNDLLQGGQAPAGQADEQDDIDSLLEQYR
jgi:hypothetical protein